MRSGQGEQARTAGWRGRRSAAVQVGIVVALLALVWWFLSVAAMRHGFFDLKVYNGAIRHWVHGGTLYDYLLRHTKYGFTYPPFAAMLMTPMALMPWNAAVLISIAATSLATLAVLYLFVDPVARRQRWSRWFTLAVAAELVAAFEPMRETMNFGQVNMLLVLLVIADVLLLVGRGRRLGGVGVGLATAIKLTPGVFILYLLVTRRFRAAGVAIATAVTVTLAAAVIAPTTSRVFWTSALFDTGRLGAMSFVSNQSLDGMVNRLDPAHPSTALWLGLVLATLVVWWWRISRVATTGDEWAGLAITGALGALISPVTWVHHLVWLLPALLVMARRGVDATGRARVVWLAIAAALYALLSSRLVWLFGYHYGGWGLLGGNAYLLAAIVLLFATPVVAPAGAGPAGLAGQAAADPAAAAGQAILSGAGQAEPSGVGQSTLSGAGQAEPSGAAAAWPAAGEPAGDTSVYRTSSSSTVSPLGRRNE